MSVSRLALFTALAVFTCLGFLNCDRAYEPATSALSPNSITGILSAKAWTKQPTAVFTADYDIASDPALIKDGSLYRMYYTCYYVDTSLPGPFIRDAICSATSSDGLTWSESSQDPHAKGLALSGIEGSWDEDVEAVYVIKLNSQYYMYYSGYKDIPADNTLPKGFPADLGLAVSTDGVHFTRQSSTPLFNRSNGSFDSDAVYSPTIINYQGGLLMIYVGHCYKNCSAESAGVHLMAATSTDGIAWTKNPVPVLSPKAANLSWLKDGVAEPALITAADGSYYLFITGLNGEGRTIGVAHATSPLGPWTISEQPIITPTASGADAAGALAPFVLLENGLVRMWYLAKSLTGTIEHYRIGYAQSTY